MERLVILQTGADDLLSHFVSDCRWISTGTRTRKDRRQRQKTTHKREARGGAQTGTIRVIFSNARMRKFVTCSTSRFAQLACGCLSGRPGKYLKQSHTPQRLIVLLIAICDLFAASVSIFHVPWFGYSRYSMFMLVKGEYFCWSREHQIFNKR